MAPNGKMAAVSTSEEVPENLRAGMVIAKAPPGEEVVISGLSGAFPESANVYHFQENLFNKVDLVNDEPRRWKLNHPEIPERMGKLITVSKFDAAFFGVSYKQAQCMEPMCRMVLEKTYEAIIDAGVNPQELKGSRTGIFVGTCFYESEKICVYDKIEPNGVGITGCSRAILTAWVAYNLGTTGPSYVVDTACSSGMYAVEHAYRAIREGKCDRAVVAASNLCLHPYVSLEFSRLGVLSPQGRCKCFDRDANGYARAEAVGAILLQKQKEARRIYATLLHAKTNCDGYKEHGITYPSGQLQKKLLEEFYQELCMDPSTVDFIEAHGTGTQVGDPEELNTLDQVYCKGRTTPLPIGSVKSNMGHTEAASGLCSITKAIIAMETGFIPPNIHYQNPRDGIEALETGRLQVVAEKQPWNGQLIGVNSFGFGGANGHVLLRWNTKEKMNGSAPQDPVPRIIVVSGRTEEAVTTILKDFESRPIDVEYVRLFHDIQKLEIPGHIYRGYTLLTQGQKETFSSVKYYSGTKRPVWFLFTGMGAHWPGMGKALMLIPAFSEIIEKFHQILAPLGIDITSVITSENPKIFDNILNVFIGTVALQIGLANILKTVGISPNGLIGHSLGELGCGYVDGCLAVEQVALIAYYYGLAILECKFYKGSMADIDLGAECVQQICPPEIEVACHNGKQLCTIAGSAESMSKFVGSLQDNGVFAKWINNANIAYHSKYVASAGPGLFKYLKKIISSVKPRSKNWISSSVPENKWNTTAARFSSAEYYTNNLLNPVLFEEACQHIPDDAITIEISPHGMFETILAHSHNKSVTNVAIMQQNHNKSLELHLCSLGKLFELGLQPQLANLYPGVQYPVSRGTPMISPLIRWDHSEDWYVTSHKEEEKLEYGDRSVLITLADEEMEFYSGHVIDGRNLFPATGYLVLVWETLARTLSELFEELSVEFENVHFHRATTIPKEGNVELSIMIQKSSGKFEVAEGGAAVVSGIIRATENPVLLTADISPPLAAVKDLVPLSSKDIYKELRLRGYNYSGLFHNLISVEPSGEYGKMRWCDNWVAFMDNMLQIQILHEDTRSLFVPTVIEKLVISAGLHMQEVKKLPEKEKELPIYVYKDLGIVRCGGVEVQGLNARAIAKRKPLGDPVLEKHIFIANEEPDDPALDLAGALRACVHIALENQLGINVKTVELVDNEHEAEKQVLSPTVALILGDLPLIQADITVLSNGEHPALEVLNPSGYSIEDRKLVGESNSMLVMVSNILQRPEVLQTAVKTLSNGACILAREKVDTQVKFLDELCLAVVFQKTLQNEKWILLKKDTSAKRYAVVHITDKNYNWLPEAQNLLANCGNGEMNVIFVAQREPFNGILGLFNCIRKETGGKYARCFFIMDESAPKFDPDLEFYKQQLHKDLAVNVFKDGKWGSYRHLPLVCSSVISAPHAYATVKIRGDLSTFQWLKGAIDPYNPTLKPHQHLVHIYYSAVNFRDVMNGTGKIFAEFHQVNRLTEDKFIGMEFSGRTSHGERVMGMVPTAALANVVGSEQYLWKVPDHWSLEEAATVPIVYCTAYFAFIIGKLKKGDTVLIHAGSGGVGQAAINICLHVGCTVFTTVGTQEKRDFIKKKYPQLTDRHIGNSRDTSFEQLIMAETGGRGVDIVLNSLADEKLQASVRCLAFGGRFLEIGKYDIINNNPLGMETFLKERSFHGIMLDTLFETHTEWRERLHNILQEGIISGAVQPLDRIVFAADEVEKAFRFMAGAKHIGKVLIKIREEEPEHLFVPKPYLMQATSQYLCCPNYSYVILGGLGGFGLELADWLVLRGARKLVLCSRSGLRTGYQSSRIRTWRSYGVNVHISTADITNEDGIKMLLEQANALGQVDAIFNLAVVLRDGLFENQSESDFMTSAGPKADATRHLDKLSRIYCPNLRHFVIFSSVSCGRGNLGQTNYGMSNSVMERICEARVKEGLPGLAIQWGAIGEVGLVADMQEENTEVVIGGTLPQKVSSCLEELDKFLNQSHPIVASMVVAEKRASGSAGASAVECVSNILGICDLKTINLHSTLAELGMDSMMAVEIKQSLEREFDIYLTPKEIRSLTFSRIMELSTINKEEENSKITESIEGEDVPEGMQLIIRTVGEEKMFILDVIRLPSLTGSGTDFENTSQTGPLMFMIPGIEGMASALESLAANLKYQTLCLQMGYKSDAQNIQDLASRLLPEIENRLEIGASFSLLGHSFGGLVALELAHTLEAQGRKGQLFLIDSSPEYLSLVTKQALGFSNMEEVQIKLLCHILTLINPNEATVINMEKITKELTPINSWKERVEHFSRMSFIPKDASTQHHKAVGNALYMRVMSAIKYKWQHKNLIKSPVTLLRPTGLSAVHIKEDYGLSQYCEQKVDVHFLNGNHFTILDNTQTAKIINEAVPDIVKTGIFKDTIMAEHNTEMQSSVFAKGKQ